jgi:hypothetical protein
MTKSAGAALNQITPGIQKAAYPGVRNARKGLEREEVISNDFYN